MDDSFPIIGKIKIPNYTAVIQQVSDSKGTKINFEKTQVSIEPAKNALTVLGITFGQGASEFQKLVKYCTIVLNTHCLKVLITGKYECSC